MWEKGICKLYSYAPQKYGKWKKGNYTHSNKN